MTALDKQNYSKNKKINKGIIMNEYIAYCGLDCESCEARIATVNDDKSCEARIATVNDDNELREKVSKLWSELNEVKISPEMINCVGCRIDGVKTPFCDSICPIRKCASARKYETCADCVELGECEKVGMIHKNNSDALKNLKNLK